MCVLIFFRTFIWNISRFEKNSARYFHKFGNVYMWSTRPSCQVLMKLECFRCIFKKKKTQTSNFINIYLVGADRATDRRTHMMKLIGAFRNFAQGAWKCITRTLQRIGESKLLEISNSSASRSNSSASRCARCSGSWGEYRSNENNSNILKHCFFFRGKGGMFDYSRIFALRGVLEPKLSENDEWLQLKFKPQRQRMVKIGFCTEEVFEKRQRRCGVYCQFAGLEAWK
jgi:hypothetical protein